MRRAPYDGRRFGATVGATLEGVFVRRVVVIGTTGSGKSTLAERLAAQTGLRVIELDALFWGRDWQPVPLELFRHRVERETKDDGWIVVGNYGQVRDLVWPSADTLIWLDLPLPLVMWRLMRRTVQRAATRTELWGTGNRESFRNAFLSRQSTPVVGAQDPSPQSPALRQRMHAVGQGKARRAPAEQARRRSLRDEALTPMSVHTFFCIDGHTCGNPGAPGRRRRARCSTARP